MEFYRDGIRLMTAGGIREGTGHVLNKKKPVEKRVSCPKNKKCIPTLNYLNI